MNSLLPAIQRLAQLQRQSLDKHELVASLEHAQAANLTPVKLLMHLKKNLLGNHCNGSITPSLIRLYFPAWRSTLRVNGEF